MSATTSLQIPQDILDSAHLSVKDAKIELAISLYSQGRLSIGKARELADMSLWEFRQICAARKVPAHYDDNELENDLNEIKKL
ncbi:MAG: UPF0175 family protein [Chitinivibrionales bacterium]|nr:UPF0175 family protein [Chitinivibrionales bacterium]